jgi:hypothetical protein
MAGSGAPEPRLLMRLVWFAGLWLAGVAVVGLVALLIRAAVIPAKAEIHATLKSIPATAPAAALK